jgi:hypothetical protein
VVAVSRAAQPSMVLVQVWKGLFSSEGSVQLGRGKLAGIVHQARAIGTSGDDRGRSEHLDVGSVLARGQLAGPFCQAVVEHPARGHEQPLTGLGVGFRLRDLAQALEVVGVAMRDQHGVDDQRILSAGAGEARRRVPREQLVVAAVDEDHLAVRRLQDQPVALLHVDHRQAQQAGVPQLGVGADEAMIHRPLGADHPNLAAGADDAEVLDAITPIVLPRRAVGPPQHDDVIIEKLHARLPLPGRDAALIS